MVQFQKLLTLSLAPTILFAILSFISMVLTTHYWILTDYFVGRWLKRRSNFPEKNRFPWDDVIVDFTEPSTNATITSACMCLGAAVWCIVAYFKLRPSEMDLDYHSPLRRFWVGSAIGMAFTGLCSALGSIITHYTDKGPDEFGCTITTGKTASGGIPFSNYICSREIATCSFMGPLYDKVGSIPNISRWAVRIACNEATAVKWLQIVLILNAVAVIAVFGAQAGVRRKTRSPSAKGF
ncbi:hypothetical protein BU23DRAFT_59759 [Bimuria novae-zelandiae CBS 107.79]|uniref:Uncharacterized protein n=1 Tax=Bimuria novae-zelandiae CBS 107.79 TaxID=1447943 RepID=A0A6A5VH63_9PLEO|nr:hypothetical protein BU23DRAFT_59759 [Bimuria novae-zelandiae CBS 107.79]